MEGSHTFRRAGAACAAAVALALGVSALTRSQKRQPDAPFVPSTDEITEAMLELADVTKDDVVYDLGSGDGRVVITAAQKYGARGVGVEIDTRLVRESRENARKAGVADRVRFIRQDLFKTDISRATVVTLYLRPEVNLRLRPKLLRELKPGARVVSNTFDMGDWVPNKKQAVGLESIYYWLIPPKPARQK
ncbi:MAG TPA: class I SAM-dependent methyltransferase [Pyrinomonadaceae bacterium]|nr:class I SAM-dependent methyltransferase [Pyrinomonadaceae bacterium]